MFILFSDLALMNLYMIDFARILQVLFHMYFSTVSNTMCLLCTAVYSNYLTASLNRACEPDVEPCWISDQYSHWHMSRESTKFEANEFAGASS